MAYVLMIAEYWGVFPSIRGGIAAAHSTLQYEFSALSVSLPDQVMEELTTKGKASQGWKADVGGGGLDSHRQSGCICSGPAAGQAAVCSDQARVL